MDSFSLHIGEGGEEIKDSTPTVLQYYSEKDFKVQSQIQRYKESFGNVIYKDI